jgi:hypothetical protein
VSGGFNNPVIGGQEVLVRTGIKSSNYAAGVSGWRIARDGSAEFNNGVFRGSLAVGGTAPAAHEVIGGAIPAELTAYYTAGVTGITPHAPETVVALVEQIFDGHGNYVYRAVVVDSSATAVTSIVIGAVTAALVVTEAGRFIVNPGATLGGGRYENFTERAITILTDPADGTTVLSTRHPGDAFDVWSVNILGTQGWGNGAGLTDTYFSRTAVGDMELAQFLRIRSFDVLTANALEVRKDGEANGRLFVHVDGNHRWSDGTNPSDTGLFRRSANELSVDGDLSLSTLGDGFLVKEGANGAQGTAVLVAGQVTVNVNWIQANSRIMLTIQSPGGTVGAVYISARVVNTSFTIKSTSATDTSTVAYEIFSPA